jgi:hypothetical protein
MRKTLIITAATMLIGSSGLSFGVRPRKARFRVGAGYPDEQFELNEFSGRFRIFAGRQNDRFFHDGHV